MKPLSELSADELRATKAAWLKEAEDFDYFGGVERIITTLGTYVTLAGRPSCRAFYWQAQHPKKSKCFIGGLYYEYADVFNTRKGEWHYVQALIVVIGNNLNFDPAMPGVPVMRRSNVQPARDLFVPGEWCEVMQQALGDANRVIAEKEATAQNSEKESLLKELEAYGRY